MPAPDIYQNAPAIQTLINLEVRGFSLSVAGGRLVVHPGADLTDADVALIGAHRDAMIRLVLCCDDGVHTQRAAFKTLVEQGARVLIINDDVPVDDRSICPCCGDPFAVPTGGRCWRCQLACPLACRAPVPSGLTLNWTRADVVPAEPA